MKTILTNTARVTLFLAVLFGFISIFAIRLKSDQDKETAQRRSLYKTLDEPEN